MTVLLSVLRYSGKGKLTLRSVLLHRETSLEWVLPCISLNVRTYRKDEHLFVCHTTESCTYFSLYGRYSYRQTFFFLIARMCSLLSVARAKPLAIFSFSFFEYLLFFVMFAVHRCLQICPDPTNMWITSLLPLRPSLSSPPLLHRTRPKWQRTSTEGKENRGVGWGSFADICCILLVS